MLQHSDPCPLFGVNEGETARWQGKVFEFVEVCEVLLSFAGSVRGFVEVHGSL